MIISKIKIENYRVIRSFEYECSSGFNVFIGINGAGKSTLLRAVTILLSWFVARVKNQKGRGMVLSDEDIANGADYCLLEITLTNGISWKLYKQRSTKRTKPLQVSDFSHLMEYTDHLVEDGSLPVIAVYGVDRAVSNIPKRLHRGSKEMLPTAIYDDILYGHVDFRHFFEWLRDREDIENEAFRHDGDQFCPDKQLQAVKGAIHLTLPEYGSLRVHRSPQYFSMEKEGTEFRFDSLSDGEKCYITLVGDIARHLAMANENADDPLKCEGVIMIDEVDLHLHPSWQITVLEKFRRVFPHCQFFLTTHSPHVVSSVNSAEEDKMVVFDNGIMSVPDANVFGKESDLILLDNFSLHNVRNNEVQKRIDRLWDKLAMGEYEGNDLNEQIAWLRAHMDPSDSLFAKIQLQLALNRKNHRQ